MLFIMLPVRHLRYFLPLSLVVGWSVSGYLALFRRPVVRASALVVLLAVSPCCLRSSWSGVWQSPAAGCRSRLGQGKPSDRDPLFRVAAAARGLYWPEGETMSEPKTEADCDQFRKNSRIRPPGAFDQFQALRNRRA